MSVQVTSPVLVENVIQLSIEEMISLRELIKNICAKHHSVHDKSFVMNIGRYSRQVPERIFQALYEFKYYEDNCGVLVLRGYPIDDEWIGDCPYDKLDVDLGADANTFTEEVLLAVLGSVLGDIIGWRDQRKGKFVNDLVPLKSDENIQAGTGSKAYLEWHVEEAFSDYRADYLGLMCLRNFEKVGSTFGCIKDLKLSKEVKEILFKPRYQFLPYQKFADSRKPEPRPVLFGDISEPYIRVDPADMSILDGDCEAAWALEVFIEEMNANLKEIVLEPGDLYFIDNYRVVHGRKSFQPKYNGKDRWLKRVNIVRDLRKSRAIRKNSESRIFISY